MNKKIIKIGTRGSQLAMAQTNLVIDQIHQHFPEINCEIVVIKTMGDKILDKPLIDFGGKGAFVTEFEDAILHHDIDLAIHSAKDMPMELSSGLEILGVLTREDPRDVLITMKDAKLDQRETFLIGTSSLRRQVQIEKLYPSASCTTLRGNVNTRLKKLANHEYDAIILAAAGLHRLNLIQQEEFRFRYLTFDEIVPAAGQGIIAIEGRSDWELRHIIQTISDPVAGMELEMERRALQLLEASCHEPIGIFSQIIGNEVVLHMMKAKDDKRIHLVQTTTLDQSIELVEQMVKQLV